MKYTATRWRHYFQNNRASLDSFPWDAHTRLSEAERRAISASIQQFQLGEGSDGTNFLRLGARFGQKAGDASFLPSLRLFIAEEQMHSALLGRFMEQQGIPLLRRHWVDSVFRVLRKLMGLELCVTVLVTAECIAVPYYRALFLATQSRLLRSICERILRDEANHLEYQGETLGRLCEGASKLRAVVHAVAHRVLLAGTTLVVWKEHGLVFRAAGYSFSQFLSEAGDALSQTESAASRVHLGKPAEIRLAPASPRS